MSEIIKIANSGEFDKVLKSERPLVVHFYADWAVQCQQINEVLVELARDKQLISSGVQFFKIEAESLPDLSLKYNVSAVPSCIILKKGIVVDRVDGANAPELSKKVKQHSSATTDTAVASGDLNSQLKSLINTAPVMLFMKGTPDQPKCGFSRTIVQLLQEQNVKFGSFDILSNEQVRQGLKEYSNWPTYPQLYINGELVGGVDIFKELVASGELKSMLPDAEEDSKVSLEDRLKSLVKREKIMLFMKGVPDEPRCGFSRTIVGILKSKGVPFGHFDILEDEVVRQGLKSFSNWPTYPQLYVKGELVGGLDIVKELDENGELDSLLKD